VQLNPKTYTMSFEHSEGDGQEEHDWTLGKSN
jgi:hypothetical protein